MKRGLRRPHFLIVDGAAGLEKSCARTFRGAVKRAGVPGLPVLAMVSCDVGCAADAVGGDLVMQALGRVGEQIAMLNAATTQLHPGRRPWVGHVGD
jgi:hypothetical protein